MNKTVETFEQQKQQQQQSLQKLKKLIEQGVQEYELQFGDLLPKLNKTIHQVDDDLLKISLVGGFSEGKTSIVCAWLEKLEDSMKISEKESSNEVKSYRIDDKIELFDTPGLHGFKGDDEEKYKEKTMKYVSESHLVLYVLNAQNPIKDSHSNDLKWLFREINLLPRTIFVLSRFDSVADVADEEEYQEKLRIKKENIIGRLKEVVKLSEEEEKNIKIVAVSANPFDEGIQYWLKPSNIEEFRQYSHIGLLQQATEDTIKHNGGYSSIVIETQKSIIQDVIGKKDIVTQKQKEWKKEAEEIEKTHSHLSDDLDSSHQDIQTAKRNLREFIITYFSDLILQAENCDMHTFNDFYIREIGENGINVQSKVQNEFDRHCESIHNNLKIIDRELGKEISAINENLGKSLLKKGTSFVAGKVTGEHVKIGRDAIVTGAKWVGIDLSLKFKPWGAIKWAKWANGFLTVFSLGMELWDSIKKAMKEKEFRENVSEMKNSFNEMKKDLIDFVGSDKFNEELFPMYKSLQERNTSLQEERKQTEQKIDGLNKWCKEFEIIEGEYRIIK